MPKYAVRLKGTGCHVKEQEPALGFSNKITTQPRGFFATRFIDASNEDEATTLAINMIREEIKPLLMNEPDQPWTVMVDQIWEDPVKFADFAPGSGCTWFPE